MSVTQTRKTQLGRESTAGTAVAATTIWRGPSNVINDDVELTIPAENVGYFGPADRGYFARAGASLEFPETEVTFEQFPHILEAGIRTDTPAANGGTTVAYIYEYVFPTTTANTIKTYTVETGNGQKAHEMEESFVETFSLTGAPGEAWKTTSRWLGRQKTSTTFTSLSVAAVEEALFNKSKLYLDASGGTIGSTLKSNTFVGASIEVATGLRFIPAANGNLYFSGTKCTGANITGSLTLEYDTVGAAMEDAYEAGTTYLMRIDIIGTALSGSGGTHTTKLIRLDAAIKILSITPLESMDGNDTITLNWRSVQGNAGQAAETFTVVNLLSAIP